MKKRRVLKPALGVRNADAIRLTGFSKTVLANAAQRGAFNRHADHSYDVEQFESWARERGLSGFTVPGEMRGTLCDHWDNGNDDGEYAEWPVRNRAMAQAADQELLETRRQILVIELRRKQLELAQARQGHVQREVLVGTLDHAIDIIEEALAEAPEEIASTIRGAANDRDAYELARDRLKAVTHGLWARMDAEIPAAESLEEVDVAPVGDADGLPLRQQIANLRLEYEAARLAVMEVRQGVIDGSLIDRAVIDKPLRSAFMSVMQMPERLASELAPSLMGAGDTFVVVQTRVALDHFFRRLRESVGELLVNE